NDEGTYNAPDPIGPLKYRLDLDEFIDSDLKPVQATMKQALVDATGDDIVVLRHGAVAPEDIAR
ncbi:MAG: hypothetical protein P8N02_09735, partial [Actinomycetota bacterium]|nr:hypothetical protein [Actinomycetota bacterium]